MQKCFSESQMKELVELAAGPLNQTSGGLARTMDDALRWIGRNPELLGELRGPVRKGASQKAPVIDTLLASDAEASALEACFLLRHFFTVLALSMIAPDTLRCPAPSFACFWMETIRNQTFGLDSNGNYIWQLYGNKTLDLFIKTDKIARRVWNRAETGHDIDMYRALADSCAPVACIYEGPGDGPTHYTFAVRGPMRHNSNAPEYVMIEYYGDGLGKYNGRVLLAERPVCPELSREPVRYGPGPRWWYKTAAYLFVN